MLLGIPCQHHHRATYDAKIYMLFKDGKIYKLKSSTMAPPHLFVLSGQAIVRQDGLQKCLSPCLVHPTKTDTDAQLTPTMQTSP